MLIEYSDGFRAALLHGQGEGNLISGWAYAAEVSCALDFDTLKLPVPTLNTICDRTTLPTLCMTLWLGCRRGPGHCI